MKPKTLFLCPGLLLTLLLGACGIEVGNPSEPTPVPTKAEVDRDTLLQLAGTQVEEGVQAALESFESSSLALALKRGGLGRSVKCQNSNSGVSLSFQDEFEDKSLRGPAGKRLSISEKVQNSLRAEVEGSSLLACPQGSVGKLRFDWSSLNQLNIKAESERQRERSIALQANASKTLKTSTWKSSVKKQVSITKGTSSSTGYTLFKTLAFEADSIITQDKEGATSTLQVKTSTPSGSELRMQEDITPDGRKAGFKIISGSLSTQRDNNLKVRMDYENLVFSDLDTCYPTSGSIIGSVYSGEQSEVVTETFTLLFGSEGPSLRYADGTEADLILETCQLNPY